VSDRAHDLFSKALLQERVRELEAAYECVRQEYDMVFRDRDEVVRLLRELRDGCRGVLGDVVQWSNPSRQINFEAAIAAAEKYLEGKP
jgi:hypothetical protein